MPRSKRPSGLYRPWYHRGPVQLMLTRVSRAWPFQAVARVLLVAAVLGGVGYAFVASWSQLDRTAWTFSPLPAAVAFALWFAAFLWVAPLWVTVCRSLGGTITLRQGVRIHLISNLGKYLPGKVLHAVGLVVMARNLGVPGPIGVTSVLVELALSLTGAGLVSLLALPLVLDDQRAFLVPVVALAIGFALCVMHPAVLGRLLRLGSRFVPGARDHFDTDRLLPYPKALLLLSAYAASWLILGSSLFASAQIVHPLNAALLPQMAGVMALSYLFGLVVPFAPAGLGARESATALFLATLMPLPAAVATSVLARVIGIMAEAFGAAVATRL